MKELIMNKLYSCLLCAGALLFSVNSFANTINPVVFNAPLSVRPGDIVGFQGENFGATPSVILEGVHAGIPSVLPLVNTFGTGWLSFRIPQNITGSLIVHVNNGQTNSTSIKLNAARAYHLDALQIIPNGAFRIFGRNLDLPGYTPAVTVGGSPAVVNLSASNENMLVVTAPLGLSTTSNTVITVDNGNGTGPSVLDRKIAVIAGSTGDPYALGVGWAAAFSAHASTIVNAKTDSRLGRKVVCDGVTDDTAATQAAIQLAGALGGGVVQLPVGTCRFAGGVQLQSGVVLQGAGKDVTTINSVSGAAFYATAIDLAGVRNLTVTNITNGIQSPKLISSTRVFIQNVKFNLAGGQSPFLSGNQNYAVEGCDFLQPINSNLNGPLTVGGASGLYFAGNTFIFADGAPSFDNVHDAYIVNNHFSRDVTNNQSTPSIIHSLTMNFAYRIAIVNNVFDVIGGPITNVRGDGETMLTEGGGGKRTENLGTVASATATTITDPTNTINVLPFGGSVIPEDYGVAIVGGTGAGQSRQVTGYSNGTLTVDRAWDSMPDSTSNYATFVWGLEKSLIKGNTLSQNPRGIWLYQTAVREVDIVSNTISEGGGIFLRSAQIYANKLFDPIYGVRIANNTIINTTQHWQSYINVIFNRADITDFGIGVIGVEIRNNNLQANKPNMSITAEFPMEGYSNWMHAEGATQALSLGQNRLLGTIFQNNTFTNSDTGIMVRNGANGTVLDGNLGYTTP